MTVNDLHEIRADRAAPLRLRPPTRRDDGSLVGEMVVVSVGVLDYPRGDGTVRSEYVPRDTLADDAAIESLRNRPIIAAPGLHWSDVGPDQIERYRIGHITSAVSMRGDDLVAEYVIDTRRGLDLVFTKGLRDVSAGYRVVAVPQSGTTSDGKLYSYVQRQRRYNHVLLTERGRDPNARLRADEMSDEQGVTRADMEGALSPIVDALAALSTAVEALTPQRGDGVPTEAGTYALSDAGVWAPFEAPRGDSEEDRITYAARRADALALAKRYEVTVEDGRPLADIERAVASAVDEDLRADASDADVAAVLRIAAKAPARRPWEVQRRADAPSSGGNIPKAPSLGQSFSNSTGLRAHEEA